MYLSVRPPVNSQKLFIGERGALTDVGVRSLCNKYSCLCGFKIHPHKLRHTFALQFLKASLTLHPVCKNIEKIPLLLMSFLKSISLSNFLTWLLSIPLGTMTAVVSVL